jgi:hypothetical protein
VRLLGLLLFISLLPILGHNVLFSQTITWQGQASGWLTGNHRNSLISLAGFRYIPDFFFEKTLTGQLHADAEISFNTFITGNFNDWENPGIEGKFKPYRLWARLSGNQVEARIGLQKINFGSALLFRPLMWFDRIDPRDPLQLTDGVYGLLFRYYFQNNTNIWLWGLYGNNEPKGWEVAPTEDNGIEFGGRFQIPIFTGEAGISYHHRIADFSQVASFSSALTEDHVSENRLAFDGKWDVEIGLWFEVAIVQRNIDIALMKHQRLCTIGSDYTFSINNGLHVLSEFFNYQNSDKILGSGEGSSFSGLSADYPLGLLDKILGIYYYDWMNHNNYLWLNWQRTYDNWIFYLIGFFNPETVRLNQTQTGSNVFSGNGFQIMVVFNH